MKNNIEMYNMYSIMVEEYYRLEKAQSALAKLDKTHHIYSYDTKENEGMNSCHHLSE